MCQFGANRNQWAGYRISQSPTPTCPERREYRWATTDWAHHVGSSSGLITTQNMFDYDIINNYLYLCTLFMTFLRLRDFSRIERLGCRQWRVYSYLYWCLWVQLSLTHSIAPKWLWIVKYSNYYHSRCIVNEALKTKGRQYIESLSKWVQVGLPHRSFKSHNLWWTRRRLDIYDRCVAECYLFHSPSNAEKRVTITTKSMKS